jgi:hypothetical protein
VPATTVPTTTDELFDPAWLVAAFDDLADDDRVLRVERTDSSRTRAEKLRFAVTIQGRDGVRVQYYCTKAYLDGSSSTGIVSEARFYRDLAPRLDVRRPRVPYVAVDGTDGAIIVMEDVVAAGGLFMNPHRTFPVDVARDSVSQLAHLHASTWGLDQVDDVGWLGKGPMSIVAWGADRLQALLDDGRAEGLPAALRDGQLLHGALEIQAARPDTCVLHGDPHTGNLYLDADGRACFFDWEVVQRGNWSQDVAYHLATVLSTEDRRAHEQELVHGYLSELADLGGPAIDAEDGWELYRRSFAYGYLLWVITVIRGRDEVLAHMPRLAAAIDDHDMYHLLGIA